MSKLYVVGTPIGNLGDFSPRAVQMLKEVDFIAAEDTRISRVLLNHFSISTPVISYHQHNEKQRSEEIVSRILAGESCGIITDAGMPGISDPGEELVRQCSEAGIPVIAVPGPTAAMSALAISGLATRRFSFEGFIEGKPSQRLDYLFSLKDNPRTLIFYEAPHKLLSTLEEMSKVFGNRKVALCREITKLYEEVIRTTLPAAVEYYNTTKPRGEFVIILEGAASETVEAVPLDKAVEMVTQRAGQGVSLSVAAKEVAQITGYKKSELYKKALTAKG